jgi:nucleoside-diphosphate-sugar epimerase
MQVAVTGASGHVGSALVRALLSEGHSVTALFQSDTRAIEGLPVTRAQVRIEDRSAVSRALAGAEVVFHAAARISLSSREDPDAARVNVEGTTHVVEACRSHGVRRLVHYSTIHALDARGELLGDGQGFAYERSKVLAERTVLASVEAGLDAVVVSPCAVLGPFDFKPSYMAQVLQLQRRGLLLATVAGGQSWVDVRDVAAAAISAASRGVRGRRYVISGTWMTMRDLAIQTSRLGDLPRPRFVIPKRVANAVAPAAESIATRLRLPALFTQPSMDALEDEPRPIGAAAERDLGHRPRPIRETLADTLAWLRELEGSERGAT